MYDICIYPSWLTVVCFVDGSWRVQSTKSGSLYERFSGSQLETTVFPNDLLKTGDQSMQMWQMWQMHSKCMWCTVKHSSGYKCVLYCPFSTLSREAFAQPRDNDLSRLLGPKSQILKHLSQQLSQKCGAVQALQVKCWLPRRICSTAAYMFIGNGRKPNLLCPFLQIFQIFQHLIWLIPPTVFSKPNGQTKNSQEWSDDNLPLFEHYLDNSNPSTDSSRAWQAEAATFRIGLGISSHLRRTARPAGLLQWKWMVKNGDWTIIDGFLLSC